MSETNKDITSKPYSEVIRAAIVEALSIEEGCYRRECFPGSKRSSLVTTSLKALHASRAIERDIDAMIASGEIVEVDGLLRRAPEVTPRERTKRTIVELLEPVGEDDEMSLFGLLVQGLDAAETLSVLGEMLAAGEIAMRHYKGEAYVRLVPKDGAREEMPG